MSKYSDKQKKLAEGEVGFDYSQIVEQSQNEKIVNHEQHEDNRKLDIELKSLSIAVIESKITNINETIERNKQSLDVLKIKIRNAEENIAKWKLKIMNIEKHINDAPNTIKRFQLQLEAAKKDLKRIKQTN